jgi:hypothetical protein
MAQGVRIMKIYFLSGAGAGTDAPSWWIGPDGKVHRDPGWNPEAVLELTSALRVIKDAAHLKTPGLAANTIHGVMEFAQKQLNEHVGKEGGAVIIIG